MNEQLLTVEEVAKRIRMTPHTVRKYLREEVIPAIKMPDGTWLVRESAVNDYLAKRTYQKPEESK